VEFISGLVDRVVDFTGPYVAVGLLALVIILILYRLMGRV
jgi:hypothetical protein